MKKRKGEVKGRSGPGFEPGSRDPQSHVLARLHHPDHVPILYLTHNFKSSEDLHVVGFYPLLLVENAVDSLLIGRYGMGLEDTLCRLYS